MAKVNIYVYMYSEKIVVKDGISGNIHINVRISVTVK